MGSWNRLAEIETYVARRADGVVIAFFTGEHGRAAAETRPLNANSLSRGKASRLQLRAGPPSEARIDVVAGAIAVDRSTC